MFKKKKKKKETGVGDMVQQVKAPAIHDNLNLLSGTHVVE